jgi:hypothetical protein
MRQGSLRRRKLHKTKSECRDRSEGVHLNLRLCFEEGCEGHGLPFLSRKTSPEPTATGRLQAETLLE